MLRPNTRKGGGYVPLPTKDGTVYFVTNNGGNSMACQRVNVTVAGVGGVLAVAR